MRFCNSEILSFLKANIFFNTTPKELNILPVTKFHKFFQCLESIRTFSAQSHMQNNEVTLAKELPSLKPAVFLSLSYQRLFDLFYSVNKDGSLILGSSECIHVYPMLLRFYLPPSVWIPITFRVSCASFTRYIGYCAQKSANSSPSTERSVTSLSVIHVVSIRLVSVITV